MALSRRRKPPTLARSPNRVAPLPETFPEFFRRPPRLPLISLASQRTRTLCGGSPVGTWTTSAECMGFAPRVQLECNGRSLEGNGEFDVVL